MCIKPLGIFECSHITCAWHRVQISTIVEFMESCKRKALIVLTNTENDAKEPPTLRPNGSSASLLFSICATKRSELCLVQYKGTDHISYDQFMSLMMEENDKQ